MSDRKGTVSAYGPNATEARARAAREAIDAVGIAAEMLAIACPPERCVLFGRVEHLDGLVDLDPAYPRQGDAFAVFTRDRKRLAAQLAALGRESDVSKVLHGPPDDPPLPAQRLFVIALDGLVAVTWSTPPVNALAVAARLLS